MLMEPQYPIFPFFVDELLIHFHFIFTYSISCTLSYPNSIFYNILYIHILLICIVGNVFPESRNIVQKTGPMCCKI